MKNKITHISSVLMVFAMVIGLTACGVELESRTTSGVTLSVPSDFNEFKDQSGMQIATDEDSTETIIISAKGDGQGIKASDYDQDTYQQAYLGAYKDVSFEKFDNAATVDGKTAIYAHVKATNDKDVKFVMHNYIIFFDDGNCQTVSLGYADNGDTSLKSNIDEVLKSIKFS